MLGAGSGGPRGSEPEPEPGSVVPVRAPVHDAERDRSLHRRLVGGDETALAEVYDLFSSLVLGLASGVTRDRAAAEDVAQEVFVSLWERPFAYDPDRGTLRTWLGTLAHRRAVDWVRAEERRRARSARRAGPEEAPGVEDEVLAADEAGRVRNAVAALPGGLREVIELAYYRGLTYRQVARDLGLPEGTAKSRIRLGLRRIAAMLAEEPT
ncbi:sigma-70 family RNA polymerase sigma factor [Bailinhaonella thermotolerans]|uniref:Sigma-70 family RNA polymerase sigma factor n=1 Tax=Bailinhaonella thermotolerans TaxID=1070861 RepID=A0A3A4B7I8_9ACTN|nr:sigma-70 family RNA polymerase sigma factor [Bailinhaonella thermotolerans]